MTALSVAAAGIGAVLPGSLTVGYKNTIRAGGALGLFVIVWFFKPVIEDSVVQLKIPDTSPDLVISAFLASIDQNDALKSFDQLDATMKEWAGVTLQTWKQILDTKQNNVGSAIKRQQVGITPYISPAGLPLGVYRQVNFLTKFSKSSECREEEVTVRATQDERWRVYSYQISPQNVACPQDMDH
jgi:hypothetical protein